MIRIHFLGILGTGMSSLGIYCQEKGYIVSGSDVKDINDTSIPAWINEVAYVNKIDHNLINQANYIVYSTAIKQNHPELIYAKKQGKKILHRSEFIKIISKNNQVISIAGTHGKTTTSSLTAWVFSQNNQQPSYLLGGIPINLSSAKFDTGKQFILEADESDGSFLNYDTDICVITNIEADHLENHNNSFENYLNAFKKFISGCNICIFNFHDAYTNSIINEINGTTFYSFGYDSRATFQIIDIIHKGSTQLIQILAPDNQTYAFETKLLGKYNAENAVAAWILGYLNKIELIGLSNSISSFEGVKRRCEHIGQININQQLSIPVLDDYGHHPTECNAVIKEFKRQNKKIIHIFQPHRYSRLTQFFDEFIETLKESDVIIIQDVYTAGEIKKDQKDSLSLVNTLDQIHPNVFHVNDSQNVVSIVNEFLDQNSVILFQGAGSISQMAHECAKIWNQN